MQGTPQRLSDHASARVSIYLDPVWRPVWGPRRRLGDRFFYGKADTGSYGAVWSGSTATADACAKGLLLKLAINLCLRACCEQWGPRTGVMG